MEKCKCVWVRRARAEGIARVFCYSCRVGVVAWRRNQGRQRLPVQLPLAHSVPTVQGVPRACLHTFMPTGPTHSALAQSLLTLHIWPLAFFMVHEPPWQVCPTEQVMEAFVSVMPLGTEVHVPTLPGKLQE